MYRNRFTGDNGFGLEIAVFLDEVIGLDQGFHGHAFPLNRFKKNRVFIMGPIPEKYHILSEVLNRISCTGRKHPENLFP
jgi:hypothetical protein